ncbi:ankyrin repeat protein, partial [Baffinella frigidus]
MWIAARAGETAEVQRLIALGADVSAKPFSTGATPLHTASENGREEVVKVLLDAGADVEAKTTVGATPLYVAASNGHAGVVRILLNAGA